MTPQASASPRSRAQQPVGGQREQRARRARPPAPTPAARRRAPRATSRISGAQAHARAPSSRSAGRARRGARQTSAASAGRARARSRAAGRRPSSRLGRWSSRACRSATAPGSRSPADVDLAAVDLVGDLDPEVLEHRRRDVGREHDAVGAGRGRGQVARRSPRPAIPTGSSCCSAPAPGGDRDQQVVRRRARRPASAQLPGPGAQHGQPRRAAARRRRSAAAIAHRARRSSTPIRVASPLSASAATGIPASARVEASRPGTMFAGALSARSTVRSQSGSRDAAVADVEARQLAVVEVLVDAVALADVEEGLRDGHRPEPGADQPGGELGDRRDLLDRGPVGQHRDHHPGPGSSCAAAPTRGRRGAIRQR